MVAFYAQTTDTPTRFPELGYRKTGNVWRIVDRSTGEAVGPQYRTRAELLADLPRFAEQFGCDL